MNPWIEGIISSTFFSRKRVFWFGFPGFFLQPVQKAEKGVQKAEKSVHSGPVHLTFLLLRVFFFENAFLSLSTRRPVYQVYQVPHVDWDGIGF